jgi:ornithine--oxo-acid transaminase
MNSGAEAVETVIKAVRKWGYQVKGIPAGQAELIVCANNFHGRTITIVGFSTDPKSRKGFEPFTPGFKIIPFGDAAALAQAITPTRLDSSWAIQGRRSHHPAAGYWEARYL